MKRMNKHIAVVIAVAMAAGLSGVARVEGAATVFTENFESPSWPGTGTLSSSPTNGWILRAPTVYAISSAPSPQNQVLEYVGPSYPNVWVTGGKLHGVTPTSNALELSGQIALSGTFTCAQLWLADANQNGYGIYLWRQNYNQASIVKFAGSTTPFGGIPGWTVQQGEHSTSTVPVGLQDNGFIEYHLRLQQAGPGGPVSLSMWYTNSNFDTMGYPTSVLSPAMQLVDDGSGSVFFNSGTSQVTGLPVPTYSAPIDLSSLQYVGLTFTQNGQARIDTITVADVVPEPSVLALAAMAMAVLFGRRKVA